MIHGGVTVAVEVWSIPAPGATILLQEPPGLTVGKVKLADGSEVLGVLGRRQRGRPRVRLLEFRQGDVQAAASANEGSVAPIGRPNKTIAQ